MNPVSISLTERLITRTINYNNIYSQQSLKKTDKILPGIINLISAIAISIFAAFDLFVHLSFTIGHTVSYILQTTKVIKQKSNTNLALTIHVQQIRRLASLVLFGSFIAVTDPNKLKSYLLSTPTVQINNPSNGNEQKIETSVVLPSGALKKVQIKSNGTSNEPALTSHLDKIQQLSPYHSKQHFWDNFSLNEKSVLVQILSTDSSPIFSTIRSQLAGLVYRKSDKTKLNDVRWLSPKEIKNDFVTNYHQTPKDDFFLEGYYFHATREHLMKLILSSKIVKVTNSFYSGAFVSTKPEYDCYGSYVLAFRRNIERLSPLKSKGGGEYYAGFSQPIPVNESTLAYIIVRNATDYMVESLQLEYSRLFGRVIKVIESNTIGPYVKFIANLNMGIPAEWPETAGNYMK